MRIKLRHRDKQFVKDVVKHFKLKRLSAVIQNKKIALTVRDLTELSKCAPNNLSYFSCKTVANDSVCVIAFMGSAIIFNEEKNTIVLEGNKRILFMAPKISLYLKPLLLTKEYLDIVSTDEKNVDARWYELETKDIAGSQFIHTTCPQCQAPVTMFKQKIIDSSTKKPSSLSSSFGGPEFARKWLSEIPKACDECGYTIDSKGSKQDSNCDDEGVECIIHCNRCGYSTNQ